MTAQQQAAMQEMIDWLADERELGHPPSDIEIAGEFDLHEMHYYIFKYKKTTHEDWLLGVCGGYENLTDTEHCGHIFSEMEMYDPATAEQEAIKLVEMIRAFWMQKAAAYEEGQHSSVGNFQGFVLLNSAQFDFAEIKAHLRNDWNITYSSESDEEENEEKDDETFVFEADGCTLIVSYIDAPIPNGEAEYYAQGNYMWKEAEEVTKTHVAQIIVATYSNAESPLHSGRMYTKLVDSCLKLPNAIGVYTSGTVIHPEYFEMVAKIMKEEDLFPLLNLVYFGLVGTETGVDGYTYGLKAFGKDEIEVLNSQLPPAELHGFMADISSYVVEGDITLIDGETIGFSAEQKLPISRSEGVYVDGETVKIKY